MKLLQFYNQETCKNNVAVWNPNRQCWLNIHEFFDDFPTVLQNAIPFSSHTLDLCWIVAETDKGKPLDYESLRILPPILTPSKILCVGLNYADHAIEFGDPIPTEPVIFNKAPSSLNCHRGEIHLTNESNRIDYEAELVIIIGREAKNIPEKNVPDYIAGYTCGNDVSARDWQKDKPGGQWFLGKSFDTFAPIGPWLVLSDEIENPNKLAITSRLNGQVMQSSNTSNFIFPVEKLVSYISRVMTLYPGDLVFTGTPGGVGERRTPPVYLNRGDCFEVEIEKIGTLVNTVVS